MRIQVLLLALVCAGCSAARPTPPSDTEAHIGDDWFVYRASTLGLSVDQTRARDANLPDGTDGRAPESGTLDEVTAAEAAVLWKDNCAGCHGAKGVPPAAAEGQKQPRQWTGMGPTMGFLFGGDRMRAGIYETIAEGRGSMAGWSEHLSREQTWALVAHIESF